jgi:hypothetical protein
VSVESEYVASANGSSASGSEESAGIPSGPAAGLALIRSRPEVLVGAAFAGGMIAAFLLRRLGR